MSDLTPVIQALQRIFTEEGQRIVFWNDPEQEFRNTLPFLMLDGVTTLRLDQLGALEVKLRVERGDSQGRFLLYAPTEEPDYEDDWLLDIRLYSRSFRADRASILLQELGLVNQHLRAYLADRRKFLDAKERLLKLKSLLVSNDAAADIDRKMIAVVAKADQAEPFNLVRTIFHAWTDGGPDLDLDAPPVVWDNVEKFDLDGPFWPMVNTFFGYAEDNPSLKNLLLRLLVTDFAYHLKGEVPQSLRGLLLPRTGWLNAVVCLGQWRDSSSKGSSYDCLSAAAAVVLRMDEHLPEYEIPHLFEVMTFLSVEKRIASCLRAQVQSTATSINAGDVQAVATKRQAGHWASATLVGSEAAPREAFHAIYDAEVAAADFFALRNLHKAGFDYPDAVRAYRAYESELFRFDQLYRRFCEAADQAEEKGWGILKSLRDDVESCYTNWFLPALVLAWGKHIEPPAGLLHKWQIDGVANQQSFYERSVRPWLEGGDNRRAFVIVSDAFRYEAAQELGAVLNGTYRVQADLRSQLGVLPSYTALGMASLLPHKTLAYKTGTSDVLVDGRSSEAGDRDAVVRVVGGMACKAHELMAKKKDDGREFVKESRVVYVYHDKVDAIGDDRKTEHLTFQAVREAIDELAALVGYIVNNLNGNYVVVTADHGFLFTESAPGETDKSKLGERPDGTVLVKKRYLLGRQLPDHPSAWHGQTEVTAGAEGGMEFWTPKGANRFHFTGGARFVHGGAMPQEIVVPVLTVRQIKGKGVDSSRPKPLTVQVLGSNHRITIGRHRFQLIQMEPVSERVKPVTLKVAVYEGETVVTNVESVTFESASGNMDERKKWVTLVLVERPYNKKTPYRLVLRDAETGIEMQSVEVIIDRTFSDDF